MELSQYFLKITGGRIEEDGEPKDEGTVYESKPEDCVEVYLVSRSLMILCQK